ncbi:unnamed protein product, partial [Protopolystoma xenopodis]
MGLADPACPVCILLPHLWLHMSLLPYVWALLASYPVDTVLNEERECVPSVSTFWAKMLSYPLSPLLLLVRRQTPLPALCLALE